MLLMPQNLYDEAASILHYLHLCCWCAISTLHTCSLQRACYPMHSSVDHIVTVKVARFSTTLRTSLVHKSAQSQVVIGHTRVAPNPAVWGLDGAPTKATNATKKCEYNQLLTHTSTHTHTQQKSHGTVHLNYTSTHILYTWKRIMVQYTPTYTYTNISNPAKVKLSPLTPCLLRS